MGQFRIGVVGCGAISSSYYFPALAASDAVRRAVWLIDPSEQARARAVERFGFETSQQVASIDDLPVDINAAINASPSHLHLATTIPLIERGAHVLVEKPFAEIASDGSKMIQAANGSILLGANHFRRLVPSYALVREFLLAGRIGAVRSIVWNEGHKFDWPTLSGFYFRRPWGGRRPRGALLDIGVHVLDALCWWLGEEPEVVECVMDSGGGPETFATAELRAGETRIEIAISFLAKLSNECVIEGDAGSIRLDLSDSTQIFFRPKGGSWRAKKARGPSEMPAIGVRMVDNFISAARGDQPLLIDAESAMSALRVVDALYDVAIDRLPRCYEEWMQ